MINFFKQKLSWSFVDKKLRASIDIDKKFIAKFLPDKPSIIDCGAHIGLDTVQLAQIKGSKIFSFEPIEHLYLKLVANTSPLQNVKCFKLALNAFDGKAEMHISSGRSDASSSLLKPKIHLKDHPEVLFKQVTKVDCLTLDSWAWENNESMIDMLWLDMQGSELEMLKASKNILGTVSVIHSEVSLRETYEGVEHYEVYKRFLLGHNFKVIKEAIPKGFDMGNVLFVKN